MDTEGLLKKVKDHIEELETQLEEAVKRGDEFYDQLECMREEYKWQG